MLLVTRLRSHGRERVSETAKQTARKIAADLNSPAFGHADGNALLGLIDQSPDLSSPACGRTDGNVVGGRDENPGQHSLYDNNSSKEANNEDQNHRVSSESRYIRL